MARSRRMQRSKGSLRQGTLQGMRSSPRLQSTLQQRLTWQRQRQGLQLLGLPCPRGGLRRMSLSVLSWTMLVQKRACLPARVQQRMLQRMQ